jgi:hypothetical protein
MHDCAPEWSPQHRQSVPSEKLTCEFARYSVHKHFYGKPGTKFRKMLIRQEKGLVFTQLFQLPFRQNR